MVRKIKRIKKPAIILLIFVIIAIIGWLVYRAFGPVVLEVWQILQSGNQSDLANYIQEQGHYGAYIALFMISVLQVVSVILPGVIIQFAGAFLFGWWRAFLLCWLGFTAGNILVFAILRGVGRSIRIAMKNTTPKENWLMKKINEGKPIFVVAVSCMLPGIPNGIIPYVAAHAKISLKDFSLAIFCSSWIQILLSCISGHFLAEGNYVVSAIAVAIQVVSVVVILFNKDKILEKL